MDASPKSSIAGSVSNLLNSIVGAGIIGLPFAFSQTGLVTGTVLLMTVSVMTEKSLRMLTSMCSSSQVKHLKIKNFEDLAELVFGKAGRKFVLFNMFILAYGAMVAYLLIIKDTVPTLIGFNSGFDRELVMIGTSMSVMLPLAMQKHMSTLSFTSFLSVTADAILVLFVSLQSPVKESLESHGGFVEIMKEDAVKPTLFIGLGIISTAMACQHSCFIIHDSLDRPTCQRWGSVTSLALGLAFIMCVTLATMGYLGFLDETYGDVLNNFDNDSKAANGARALLAFTMFFTYPMESFVARHVLLSLIDEYSSLLESGDRNDDENDGNYESRNRNMFCSSWLDESQFLALIIYFVALLPAVIFDDLGPVLSITGSIGGSCIAYIGPGLTYLGIHGKEFVELVDRNTSKPGVEIELPVAGDAQGKLSLERNTNQKDVPTEGRLRTMVLAEDKKWKRSWVWYITLCPIWYAVAQKADRIVHSTSTTVVDSTDGSHDDEFEISEKASARDFCVAIIYVLFGLVAAVAGLVSIFFVKTNEYTKDQ